MCDDVDRTLQISSEKGSTLKVEKILTFMVDFISFNKYFHIRMLVHWLKYSDIRK